MYFIQKQVFTALKIEFLNQFKQRMITEINTIECTIEHLTASGRIIQLDVLQHQSRFSYAARPSDSNQTVIPMNPVPVSYTHLDVYKRQPLGRIIIARTPYYTGEELPVIYISRSDLYATTTECIQHLTATLPDDKAAVISLSYQDVSIQRAEDVLNTLISVYNENWVKDKNQIAISTSRFINERLGVIEQELGTVDDDISSYKSEHLLPDVQAVSNMYMVQANETNTQIKELNNPVSYTHLLITVPVMESDSMQSG